MNLMNLIAFVYLGAIVTLLNWTRLENKIISIVGSSALFTLLTKVLVQLIEYQEINSITFGFLWDKLSFICHVLILPFLCRIGVLALNDWSLPDHYLAWSIVGFYKLRFTRGNMLNFSVCEIIFSTNGYLCDWKCLAQLNWCCTWTLSTCPDVSFSFVNRLFGSHS